MSEMDPQITAEIEKMKDQGHTVRPHMREDGLWFEIDDGMLASYKEMKELGAGVYSFKELKELMRKRREEEQGRQ